ncbi:MAG: CD3324 family protein [Treponema sp.]|nr:CD3324 family protein [Treponema sp.]
MKYLRAPDVLPEELLKEVQKYTEGSVLYIPKAKEHKKWGEESGARSFYRQRNSEIREKYMQKVPVERLADEYCLSEDMIRKILFR